MSLKARIDEVIDAALGHRIVGGVILVNEKGKPSYERAFGYFDREANVPMPKGAIFRYSSLTKPFVATATLRMTDSGLLRLDDPVTKYLPFFTPAAPDSAQPAISIRQLLTHTSGLSYGSVPAVVAARFDDPGMSLEVSLRGLATVPLGFCPGKGWAYGMSMDVLGGVLAAIAGRSLGAIIIEHVTAPLGIQGAQFHLSLSKGVALPYADGRPPHLMADPETVIGRDGSVTFSPSRIFNAKVPHTGGSGMAGTAQDMMKLLEVYQPGSTFLREETRRLALTNQINVPRPNDPGRGFGLIGSFTFDSAAARTPCSNGSTDWGGVYGHSWIVDPIRRISMVSCTNTALEGCLGTFPTEIRDAIFAT